MHPIEISAEELNEYFEQVIVLLSEGEAALLKLDRGLHSFKELYPSIFRVFHSINGPASLFFSPKLHIHFHQLENELQNHTTLDLLPAEMIDYFLNGIDAAREIIEGKEVKFNYSPVKQSKADPTPASSKKKESPTPKVQSSLANSQPKSRKNDPAQDQKNIYIFNSLNSNKANFNGPWSILISDLLQIENEVISRELAIQDFADRVLASFDSALNDFNLCRVCLVSVFPVSRKLSVLSSANSKDISENLLVPGYSCFPSNASSLFLMNPSNIRIYHDIDSVIESYKRENKPVQRSIGKLKSMGIMSGLAIPIQINDSLAGYLFLNSKLKDTFKQFQNEDFSVLCILKLIAKSALTHHLGDLSNLNGIPSQLISNVFHENNFLMILSGRLSEKAGKDIEVVFREKPKVGFLYPSEGIALIISKFLFNSMILATQAKFELLMVHSPEKETVSLRINFAKRNTIAESELTFIKKLNSWTGVQLEVKDTYLEVITFRDVVKDTEYSV